MFNLAWNKIRTHDHTATVWFSFGPWSGLVGLAVLLVQEVANGFPAGGVDFNVAFEVISLSGALGALFFGISGATGWTAIGETGLVRS